MLKRIPMWLKITAICVLSVLVLLVFFKWLAALVLPFILAFAFAKLMEPAVRFFHQKCRMPRPLASLILTIFGIALILGLVFFGVSWMMREINKLIEKIPYFMTKIPEISESWRAQADIAIEAAPISLQQTLRNSLDKILAEGITIPGSVYAALVGWVSSFAGAIPSFLLFGFTVILSTYLISSDYPNIAKRLLSPFSIKKREKILFTKDKALETLGKWFRAQIYLMGLTFLLLLAGFLILRIELALLPAIVIAILDALPVIGAGFCLIPWAIISIVSGDGGLGIGLLTVYGVIVLVRSVVEPKLVSRQIGLNPLLTFAAMYVGFKTLGVLGFVLFPIFAMILQQVILTLVVGDAPESIHKI